MSVDVRRALGAFDKVFRQREVVVDEIGHTVRTYPAFHCRIASRYSVRGSTPYPPTGSPSESQAVK